MIDLARSMPFANRYSSNVDVLGLDVSVSRRTNVSSRSRLEKNCQRIGLGHLRLVPKTNFRPNCAGHSTQCERALDVISLCVKNNERER